MPFQVRMTVTVALVIGWIAALSVMTPDQVVAQVEGGPVYPQDKDVGGGARNVPSIATIADDSEPGERLVLTGTVFGHDGKPREGVTVHAYQTDAKGLYRRKPWGRPRLRGWATREAPKGTFASIRPLEARADGTLRCVRDIRLPQDW
jgi:protocatechuate 3,4-dioxygenase beta subunit